jgi:hypothetical protein
VTRGEEPQTRWVTPENLSEAQIAAARRALDSLIKLMARATVDACDRLGIAFDMDDPQVARDVMKATFEGLFMPKTEARRRRKKAAASRQISA